MAYLPKVPHIVGDDDEEEQQIPQNGNEYNSVELSELDDITSDEEDGEEGEDWSQNVHYIDQMLGYEPELEDAANLADEFSYPAENNILLEIKDELESNEGNGESDYIIRKDSIDTKIEIESMVDPNEHSFQLDGNNDPPAMSRNVRESTLVSQEQQIPSRRLRSSFRSKSENWYAPKLKETAANQADEFSYPAENNILLEIKDELESNEGNAESDYNIWKDSIDNKDEMESMVDPNEHSIQLAGNNDPPPISRNVRESTLVAQEQQIPSRRLRSSFRSKSENGYEPKLKEAAANQADEFSYPAEDNILLEIKDELESNEGNAESDYNIWKDSINNKDEMESMVDPNEHSIQLAGNNDPPSMSRNVRESTLVAQEQQIPRRRLRSSFRSKSEKSVSPITLPRSRQAAKTKVPTPILVSRRTPKSRIATKNMKRLREPSETLTVRPLDVTQYFTEISAQLVSNHLDEGAFMEMRDQIDRLVDEAIAKTKLFQKRPRVPSRYLF